MMYLISTFHYWLLLAAAFGVLVGWITVARRGGGWGGLLGWLIVLGLGGLVALMQLLPDRVGFWFEIGLMMLAAYVVGCCIGSLIGGLFGRKLGEPAKSGALAEASRPITRVMIREKERAVDPQLKPLAAAAAAPEEPVTGLAGPRGGAADDLTKIYGIDEETQGKLNALGLYHYDQIANLTPGNRRWVFRKLGHEGRFPSWWWRWRYDAEKLMGGTPVAEGEGSTQPLGLTGDLGSAAQGGADAGAASQASAQQADTAVASASDAGGSVGQGAAGATEAAVTGSDEAAGAARVADLPAEDRPPALAGPRDGKADDLKRIRGIGKQNEGRLHGLGVWHFDQIAAWSAEQAHWVGTYLAFAGRIEREDWINQAKVLASGGETEFSKRADSGKVKTSRSDIDHGETNVITPVQEPKPKKPSGKK